MLVGDMQQLHLTSETCWTGALLAPDGPATTSTQAGASQVSSAAFWKPLSSHGGEQRGAEAVEVGYLQATYPGFWLLFYFMAQLIGKVSAKIDGKVLFKLLLCSQRWGSKLRS